jgi:hypothetical protein
MDTRLLQDLKNNWRNINGSTIKFAQNVPVNMWNIKPFEKRFTTFSWEFACILRTRLCYLRAFKTGVLDFAESKEIPSKKEIVQWEKSKIVNELHKLGKEILKEVSVADTLEKVKFANLLFQHERVHQGKFIIYHSQLGLEIPKSFKKTYGESNFNIK